MTVISSETGFMTSFLNFYPPWGSTVLFNLVWSSVKKTVLVCVSLWLSSLGNKKGKLYSDLTSPFTKELRNWLGGYYSMNMVKPGKEERLGVAVL